LDRAKIETKNVFLTCGIVWGFVFLALGITILALWVSQNAERKGVGGILCVLCVAGNFILALILGINGSRSRCPKCGSWWARVFVGDILIDRKHAYTTVTRCDPYWGSYTGRPAGSSGLGDEGTVKGSTSGWTSRTEQVYVLRETFEDHYQCKFCRHSWTEITTEDSEDFEVD
jgi:hypothetical protein